MKIIINMILGGASFKFLLIYIIAKTFFLFLSEHKLKHN